MTDSDGRIEAFRRAAKRLRVLPDHRRPRMLITFAPKIIGGDAEGCQVVG